MDLIKELRTTTTTTKKKRWLLWKIWIPFDCSVKCYLHHVKRRKEIENENVKYLIRELPDERSDLVAFIVSSSFYSSYIGRCGPPPLLSLCISNWMRWFGDKFIIDRHRRPISRTIVALWASDNQSAILWPRARMATTHPVMKWLNGWASLKIFVVSID